MSATTPPAPTGITLSLDRVAGRFEVARPRTRGRPKKKAPRRPISRIWKMIDCASLTLRDAKGRALETPRYGCMPDDDPKAVTAALSDVAALRKRRPALLVGVTCDGAREMWNLLDGAVAPAEPEGAVRRLVELWHLLGYVGKALHVRHGEGRASSELVRWKLRLLNQTGAARRRLEELRDWHAHIAHASGGRNRRESPRNHGE